MNCCFKLVNNSYEHEYINNYGNPPIILFTHSCAVAVSLWPHLRTLNCLHTRSAPRSCWPSSFPSSRMHLVVTNLLLRKVGASLTWFPKAPLRFPPEDERKNTSVTYMRIITIIDRCYVLILDTSPSLFKVQQNNKTIKPTTQNSLTRRCSSFVTTTAYFTFFILVQHRSNPARDVSYMCESENLQQWSWLEMRLNPLIQNVPKWSDTY